MANIEYSDSEALQEMVTKTKEYAQPKNLSQIISVDGSEKTTVETALSAINDLAAADKTAIGNIKDGQNIDSFADVENALADKQDTLTGGNLVSIDNNTINAKIFVGTRDEWNALSVTDKAKYTLVNITDDSETGETVDAVTDGDMRAVTSNAVFDKFTNKLHDARFLTFSTENTTVSVSIPTAYRGMCFISAYANDHDGIIDVRCDNSDNVAVTKLVGASAITVDTSQKNRVSFTSTGYAVYALMQMSVNTDAEIVS